MKRRLTNPNIRKGKDRLNRSLELMHKLTPVNETAKASGLEHAKVAPDGKVYGIVREGRHYFIKITNPKNTLITEDFGYIGGLKNKMEEAYPSYSEALKHLNFRINQLNEQFGNAFSINVFESDVEEIDEDDKYVLKVDNPAPKEAPMGDLPGDLPPDDQGLGDEAPIEDEIPMDDEMPDDMGDEESDEGDDDDSDDPKTEIQSLTGELGQLMRDYFSDRGESDVELEKYVVNSVISATHPNDWDKEDIKEVIKKLKVDDEEELEDAGEELPGDEVPGEEVPAGEDEVGIRGGEMEPEDEEIAEESYTINKSLLESIYVDEYGDFIHEEDDYESEEGGHGYDEETVAKMREKGFNPDMEHMFKFSSSDEEMIDDDFSFPYDEEEGDLLDDDFAFEYDSYEEDGDHTYDYTDTSGDYLIDDDFDIFEDDEEGYSRHSEEPDDLLLGMEDTGGESQGSDTDTDDDSDARMRAMGINPDMEHMFSWASGGSDEEVDFGSEHGDEYDDMYGSDVETAPAEVEPDIEIAPSKPQSPPKRKVDPFSPTRRKDQPKPGPKAEIGDDEDNEEEELDFDF